MRKKTTEVVREEFRKEGYKLLGEYVNSHTKISFICPKGHKHSIQWGNWSQGQRCNYCSKRPIKGSEQVRESFIKEGFILPEDWEYVNSSVKIPYVCSSGHEGAIAWNNWQKGSRCGVCASARVRVRITSEQLRELFAKEGFTIPEDWEYINCRTKIPFICSSGHKSSITWQNWQNGKRCSLDAGIGLADLENKSNHA